MGNCMVTTRRRSLFQKKRSKPATKLAESKGQTLRSTSSSNRAMSSKLETTTTRSRDHIVRERRTSSDNDNAKSGAARVMRIRVVVTQSQLSQILKESRNSASLSSSSPAVKHLLLTSAVKVSRTENSLSNSARNVQGGSTSGKWRPRLRSISEE